MYVWLLFLWWISLKSYYVLFSFFYLFYWFIFLLIYPQCEWKILLNFFFAELSKQFFIQSNTVFRKKVLPFGMIVCFKNKEKIIQIYLCAFKTIFFNDWYKELIRFKWCYRVSQVIFHQKQIQQKRKWWLLYCFNALKSRLGKNSLQWEIFLRQTSLSYSKKQNNLNKKLARRYFPFYCFLFLEMLIIFCHI